MTSVEITKLIGRCRQGDSEALGELYTLYAKRMRGVCRRYLSDKQPINDVLHDSFVIIFTSFDKLRDDSKAEAWMMSITRNVAAKYTEYPNDKQTWLCGEDVDIRADHTALRSMSNPNFEGQADTYGGLYWYETEGCTPSRKNDYCGVHTNSGVLNYWFYLLCEGGSGTNDHDKSYNVNGIGIANAAKIVYRAETEYLSATSNFADMRACTLKAAEDLFPNNPSYGNSVADAWYAVGVENNPPYVQINKNIEEFPITEDSTQTDNWLMLEGNTLHISLPTNNNVVALYNTEGQKVMQQKIKKSAKIDLATLSKGVYVVIINKCEQSCKIILY